MPYFPDEGVTKTVGYAGFWWRFLAYLIDTILLGIVVAVIGSAGSVSVLGREVLAVALAFVYGTAFIATRSQTIGMMITRTRVEGVDGARVTLNQAAIRAAFYTALLWISDVYHVTTYAHPTATEARHELHHFAVLLLFSLPHIVDNLWMLWNKKKQTWHDMVAKTVVKR
jgi:uncharacterized RDD family membrane protein YckC